MNRSAFIERIFSSPEGFDLAVIGGGANGAGIALDAAMDQGKPIFHRIGGLKKEEIMGFF